MFYKSATNVLEIADSDTLGLQQVLVTIITLVLDTSESIEQIPKMSTLATRESYRKGRRGRWLVSGRFKGVQVDEILPLATLIQRCMTSAPRGIFNLSFNFDKSSAEARDICLLMCIGH